MNRRLALMLSVFFLTGVSLAYFITPRKLRWENFPRRQKTKKRAIVKIDSNSTHSNSPLFSTNIHKYHHHRPRTQEVVEEEEE
jgi:hypothetical protein